MLIGRCDVTRFVLSTLLQKQVEHKNREECRTRAQLNCKFDALSEKVQRQVSHLFIDKILLYEKSYFQLGSSPWMFLLCLHVFLSFKGVCVTSFLFYTKNILY